MSTPPPSTSTSTSTTTIQQVWVDRHLVDQMIHASDGFQIYLNLSLLCVGAVIGCVASLAGGVKHPVGVYILLAVVAAGAIVLIFVAGREHGNVKRQRSTMRSATHTFYLGAQLTVIAPGANPIPTITGIQPPPASGGQPASPPTTPQVPPVVGGVRQHQQSPTSPPQAQPGLPPAAPGDSP